MQGWAEVEPEEEMEIQLQVRNETMHYFQLDETGTAMPMARSLFAWQKRSAL